MPLLSRNPANGQIIRRYPAHTRAQIEAALNRAHATFGEWRRLKFNERARHLRSVASVLREQREPLAALITNEIGKPMTQSRAEVEKCGAACVYYAKNAASFLADERPPGSPKQAKIIFEPLGPILAIMPWNFPFWQVFRAVAPALMAGNTVVLKHSSNVSGCALAIEQICKRAGLPDGVLRTLLIDSAGLSKIISDPRIRAVTLTGSTAAGRQVAAAAGEALKPCVLELGGSDPYLIFRDADLDLAAEICASARLINAGQSCVAAKRFIVVKSVRAEFEKRFTARMAARRVGDPCDEKTEVGPMARLDLREELHRQVKASVNRGARVLLGGNPRAGGGFFYEPTVLTGVAKGMPAYNEELFGPVAAVIPVRDEDEAVAVANDSVYGLGAAVFTRNRGRGERIAREQIEAGMVFINDFVRSEVSLPFGGTKHSGLGRELGTFGLREFVNVKTVWVS